MTLEIQQGTADWYAARCGIPTASGFDRIITTKGERSKLRQKYLYELAGERLTETPLETYQSAAMLRGKELEGTARIAYELLADATVEQVGFCFKNEARHYGCSPDGLIGADGGLEIKCPTLPVAVEYLDNGKLPTDYFQQVQGSLLVTGRAWWDFFSYHPGLSPLLIRVKRDEAFIAKLEQELISFCKELDELTTRLRSK